MIDKTVTLTLNLGEAAVLGLLLKQSLDLAERVAQDDDAEIPVRMGAVAAMLKGFPILKKVADALPDKPEEAEDEDDEQPTVSVHHISLKELEAVLH